MLEMPYSLQETATTTTKTTKRNQKKTKMHVSSALGEFAKMIDCRSARPCEALALSVLSDIRNSSQIPSAPALSLFFFSCGTRSSA